MDKRTKQKIGTRILVIRVILLLCILGLGARSIQIQVLDKDLLTRKAEQAYITDLTIQGDRGGILDRHQNKLGISIDRP